MTVKEWLGEDNQLGIDIWEKKYKHKNETFDEWLDRISVGDAELKQLIVDKKFLFGGRILANRGLYKKGEKITYSNCYVLEPPEDNIESIFYCASQLARTFSYGGGVGIDISKLSPKGAKVNNSAKQTSGSVSFMDLYSLVTELIGQNGRRGALMISLDCHHPDIEDFIEIKSNLDKVTKANISIRITNDFMKAVLNNENFKLSFTREETGENIEKTVSAKDIFGKFCEMNYNYAEPAMLFWDNINNYNLMEKIDDFNYSGVNPCAEEPLPSGGSCLLGSINLSEFVENKTFNLDKFKNTVAISVRALNDVLDEGLPLHPLTAQQNSVRDYRQIGLGIFGLADMLIKLNIKYGSKESIYICKEIAFAMSNKAIETSARLAMEKCMFPKCDIHKILESSYLANASDSDTRKMIAKFGLRNSQILTCAPTGLEYMGQYKPL